MTYSLNIHFLAHLVLAALLAACGIDLTVRQQSVQSAQLDSHFAIAYGEHEGVLLTGVMSVPILDKNQKQLTVPTKKGQAALVRGTCGVTFVTPRLAITAAHCVGSDVLPDLSKVQITVQEIRVPPDAEAEIADTFEPTPGSLFPDYDPKKLAKYKIVSRTCQVIYRCGSNFGDDGCKPVITEDTDIALLFCPGRVGAYADVAAQEIGIDVENYWYHEVLDMPTAPMATSDPVTEDRLMHYSLFPSNQSQATNYHYLDLNQLYPLRALPWLKGDTLIRRTRVPVPAFEEKAAMDENGGYLPNYYARWTDLYGCHGTSGSGVFQRDGGGKLQLLGPVSRMAVVGPFGGGLEPALLCADPSRMTYGDPVLAYTKLEHTQILAAAAKKYEATH